MTQVPAGWYRDPAPSDPTSPTERYWDGFAWSHQVRPSRSTGTSAGPYPDSPYVAPSIPSTPDGQEVAGWWRRAGAVAVDAVVMTPLLVLVAVPSLATHWGSVTTWWNAGYAGNGALVTDRSTPAPAVLDPSTAPGLVLFAAMFGTSVVYALVFLRWKHATPGKLLTGLEIRPRSAPGPLGWTMIVRRVGFVAVLVAGSNIPVVGLGFLFVAVLDCLWPIWDDANQALHDKVAGTNVVLRRVARTGRPGLPPPEDTEFRPIADSRGADASRR